jgi:hypothetical protein
MAVTVRLSGVLFWRSSREIRSLADGLQLVCATLAGVPVAADRGTVRALHNSAAALALLAERRQKEQADLMRAHTNLAAVADRLVCLRQRVTDLRTGADVHSEAPLLPWLAQQVEVMIGELDVREFTDVGSVDPRRHEVLALRPTAVTVQVGLIAETLDCGLLIGSELLRRQRVVAFVAEEGALRD